MGCGRGPAPHGGPVILLTLDSLRADVIEGLGGEPGLTPRLDELIQEADWAGRAVASSSWEGSTLASLFTGLRPWQHQVLHAGRARLHPAFVTLAEAMGAAGYETAGYWSGESYSRALGFDQGFEVFQQVGKGHRLIDRLRALSGDEDKRQLVWAHLPDPQAPYVRREAFLPRLGRLAPPLPDKVPIAQLEPFFDPTVHLPRPKRRRFWAMYCLNVAWADEELGRVLDTLRNSGEWDRALVVVTANHGEEFGENGQILHGGNLGRPLIEVPLVIKLPGDFGRKIRVPKGERVAAARVFATLVEAVGGEAPPAAAPSLFRAAPAEAVSELYATNGTNQFSFLDGDLQLLWTSRFAPDEPEYYTARRIARSGGRSRLPIAESPRAIFTRLQKAFAATPPLHGARERWPPALRLVRWGEGGSTPVNDPEKTRLLARRLIRTWGAFLPEEAPLARELEEWGGAAVRRPGKPRPPKPKGKAQVEGEVEGEGGQGGGRKRR